MYESHQIIAVFITIYNENSLFTSSTLDNVFDNIDNNLIWKKLFAFSLLLNKSFDNKIEYNNGNYFEINQSFKFEYKQPEHVENPLDEYNGKKVVVILKTNDGLYHLLGRRKGLNIYKSYETFSLIKGFTYWKILLESITNEFTEYVKEGTKINIKTWYNTIFLDYLT